MKVEYPVLDLIKQEWTFIQFNMHFVFTGWRRMKRGTRRHGWKVVSHWNKYDNRGGVTEEPRLPKEVKALAVKQIAKTVKVITWSEWNGEK